ncbi:MAG: type 1 glutamine amidotransferase [Pseudomonadales bacterium]
MADRRRRCLIAVTGPNRGGAMPRLCVALLVRLAGARTVQLSPSEPDSPEPYQGVVITGGHDVDPVLYAQQSKVLPQYDPDRDALESRVIDHALERDLPLLGICRGAQLLNVRLGGDLNQDLRQHRRHTSNRRTVLPLKTLLVEPDSCLRGLIGSDRARNNSLHIEGFERLGDGLVVSGRDLDGIVQAIEDPVRRFLIGVQWHPEFLLPMAPQRALFHALVDAAQRPEG